MKMSTTTNLMSGLFFTLLSSGAMSASVEPSDSTKNNLYQWHMVSKVQSLGLFAYAGQIGCENPTFDFNFSIERGNWGYFCFKSFDLENVRSHNNFILTMVYRKIHLGNRLQLKPYLGFYIDQSDALVGKESDLSFVLTASYKLNDHWTIDNSAVYPHVLFHPDSKDWTNRFRIIYRKQHVELAMLSWHNNKLFDMETYLSEGLSAFYNKIRLSEHAALNTGITGLWMLQTSDEVASPKRNGILLTVSVSLN